MKKVIGLCLVVLLSSTSVFARENRRMDKRKMDPSARCEKMIADLKLDEKQAVEFRKLQKEYMEKVQKEREAMKAEREKQREKIAGVRVPLLENVDFEIRPYSLFNAPKWYADGLHLLKELAHTAIEREFTVAKLNLLEHARKKTTQKVNLFEKVQIPGYQDALRKIKRFMEDEENLSKSSQKIMKSHQEKRKEAEA